MNKKIYLILGLVVIMLMVFAGCDKSNSEVVNNEDTNAQVTDESEVADSGSDDSSVVLHINTEGMGQIAFVEEGGELEFDDEFPKQSAAINPLETTVYVLGAKADEGWKFVKWTKDGEDFSTDEQITVDVEKTVEYIAVFEVN